MTDILDAIVEQKRSTIEATLRERDRLGWRRLAEQTPAPPDFFRALASASTIGVIAEIKKASPSAGLLRPDFDPPAIARAYGENGAHAISVLTDAPFFQGSLDDLKAVRQVTPLPVLRKDFVLDTVQIHEAKAAGASAVLLIAECLDASQLRDFVAEIHALQMTALVELFDRDNLAAVLASQTRLVGINNRNLRTFVTDLAHTLDLLPDIPKDRLVVSESGIRNRQDVDRLRSAGVGGILVGESLMRSPNPGAKLRELVPEAFRTA